MIALSCHNIQKSYGIDLILDGIGLTLNVGDKAGLIGVNGAGKTTLMKILSGIEKQDEGDLYLSKNVTLGYLEQNTKLDIELSAFDYCEAIFEDVFDIEKKMRALEHDMALHQGEELSSLMRAYAELQEHFERLDGYSISSKIRGILNGLGFDETDHLRPINTLSGGQKSRVGIARLLLKQPDVLLLDEPTNHLDIDAIRWLETYLKDYSGSMIVISHDRYFLDQIVNTIFEIEMHGLEVYKGNYSDFVKQKAAIYASEEKRYALLQKEIQKQEELIRKFKERGTEKLAKRARSREKRLSHVERMERPILFKNHFKLSLKTNLKAGKDILRAEHLSKAYGDQQILRDLSFELYNGERIGLIGANGVGKTTLFRLLVGDLTPDSGELHWGHHVERGYFDQEQGHLHLKKTLLNEVHDDHPNLSLTEVRSLLGAFLFPNDAIEKTIDQLSGGERSRVALLKLMLSTSNVLFLDEPTNHLDINSKETLEEALLQYEGTLMFISHDRYFLNKICTKIFELTPDGLEVFWGNYDYFQEKKLERRLDSPDEQPLVVNKTQQKEAAKKEKALKQAARMQKQSLAEAEAAIESLENKIADLEASLCQEEVFSNHEVAFNVQTDIASFKKELEALYENLDTLLNLL